MGASSFQRCAEELTELRRLEKEKGISPDPEIDAFMKANAIEGKRESIETEYVLHILGLGVCADTLVCLFPNKQLSTSSRYKSCHYRRLLIGCMVASQ